MAPPPDNSKLLVISFDDPLRAQEFLLAAARLQRDDELQLHDAVIIRRDADGASHVTETTDVTPGQAGVGAATAGGGALYAKLRDTGVKDATVHELREAVPPGRTAVAMLVSHVSVADLQRELTRFPRAELVETDMPPAAVNAVQEALKEANREPFAG